MKSLNTLYSLNPEKLENIETEILNFCKKNPQEVFKSMSNSEYSHNIIGRVISFENRDSLFQSRSSVDQLNLDLNPCLTPVKWWDPTRNIQTESHSSENLKTGTEMMKESYGEDPKPNLTVDLDKSHESMQDHEQESVVAADGSNQRRQKRDQKKGKKWESKKNGQRSSGL